MYAAIPFRVSMAFVGFLEIACAQIQSAPEIKYDLIAVPPSGGLIVPRVVDSKGHIQPDAARRTMPVSSPAFIENRGQFDPKVSFQLKTGAVTLWVTRRGIVFDVESRRPRPEKPVIERTSEPTGLLDPQRFAFAADFEGANFSRIKPCDLQPGVYNFLSGPGAKNSTTGIRRYGQVLIHDIWVGIDLKLFVNGAGVEQEFVVRPGGDPRRVHVAYRGATSLTLEADGNLVIRTPAGDLRETKPTVYQDVHGQRVRVESQFKQTGPAGYTFDIGAYDPTHPLIVDPTLLFSTYLGGEGTDEPKGVTVDSAGNTYIVGRTTSTTFPNTIGPSASVVSAAFITKLDTHLNATGSAPTLIFLLTFKVLLRGGILSTERQSPLTILVTFTSPGTVVSR